MSRASIDALVKAGFVTPARGVRNEFQFSFQDLMMLRTARQLRRAKVPPKRIMRSLQKLRAELPDEMPLSGLRISAVGSEVAVRDPKGPWEVESGQMLMDFEVVPTDGGVTFLSAMPSPGASPRAWLDRGESLEPIDKAAAEAAYRTAIELAPDYADALLNLGALLCETKRCKEAVDLYIGAIARNPDSALLHFNHAIALEDQDRLKDAVASYERCLSLDPDLADAHFNTARLYEELGDFQAALRHFNAYRRLQQQ